MSWRRQFAKIGALLRRKKPPDDLGEEIRAHLAMEEQENREAGMPSEEARYAALRRFGNVTQAQERSREMWEWQWLETLLQDIRYGLRQLRRSPGLTAVAVLTLALGIGANTAIFSLIDAVMLRSIPVHDPSGLVVLRWSAHHDRRGPINSSSFGDCDERYGGAIASGCTFPYPVLQTLQSQSKVFSGITAFGGPDDLVLGGKGSAMMARGEIVSGDYFSTLGVKAAVGRTLGPGDDDPSASPAIVLSYAFWQSAFGGDRSAVGRTIVLNSVPFTIAGVAERSFTNLAPGKTQDLWLPIAMELRLNIPWATDLQSFRNWRVVLLGRLDPGVSIQKAQAAADLAFRNEVLHGSEPVWKVSDNPKIELIPAQQGLTGFRGFFSTPLYVLMVVVGLILLIACANVAGLLLSRAAARQTEMAVRLAVGAGRRRIVRQLLTESVLLSLASGAVGVLFACWGVRLIVSLISSSRFGSFPFVVAPDWRVLAFTVSICFFTGIVFGLAPAFRSARLDLTPALKANASSSSLRGRGTGGRLHLGKSLVVVQVVLSVVVLMGGGLLVRTLRNLRDINPGFDTQNLLLFKIDPTLQKYTPSQVQTYYRELQQRLAALPGVSSASYSHPALLNGSLMATGFHVEGQPEKKSVPSDLLSIGPGFLSTMHIPLMGGRTFTDEDFEQAAKATAAEEKASAAAAPSKTSHRATPTQPAVVPPVAALINQTFARKYCLGQNPLGKQLMEPGPEEGGEASSRKMPRRSWVIVGIIGDTKYENLRREIHPTVFLPISRGGAHFELRTAGNPAALIPSVRHAAELINKNLPVFTVQTQTQSIDELLFQERLIVRLSVLFGLLALLLACIGLYGMLSYEMARRRREIGIRMALGAEKGDVLRMVVGQGLRLAFIGMAIGIAGALALTRFLSSLLYGVKPTDPLTFAAVSLVLIAVALAACYLPARRAAKVDPMVALRYE
ncbi:MAG: ABC transporter permease [Acidobacteria bacterium]|nr:MAG: ABC transporter permease [Acidobacteriota bacterium]